MGNKLGKPAASRKVPQRKATKRSKRTLLKDAVPLKGRLQVIVDTREQKPLWSVGALRQTMQEGDYTTVKLEDCFCIERKSGSDMYGSLIHNHARFMRELNRARYKGKDLVVFVECSKKDFVNLRWRNGDQRIMKPKTLERIVDTVIQRRELEVVWCKDREQLRKKVYQRLLKEERQYI